MYKQQSQDKKELKWDEQKDFFIFYRKAEVSKLELVSLIIIHSFSS